VTSAEPKARDLYLGSDGVQTKKQVYGGRLSARNMQNYLLGKAAGGAKTKGVEPTHVKAAVKKTKRRLSNYDSFRWRRHNFTILPKETLVDYKIITNSP
jgi:hypothetical protein